MYALHALLHLANLLRAQRRGTLLHAWTVGKSDERLILLRDRRCLLRLQGRPDTVVAQSARVQRLEALLRVQRRFLPLYRGQLDDGSHHLHEDFHRLHPSCSLLGKTVRLGSALLRITKMAQSLTRHFPPSKAPPNNPRHHPCRFLGLARSVSLAFFCPLLFKFLIITSVNV